MFLNSCSQVGFKLALTEPMCQGWPKCRWRVVYLKSQKHRGWRQQRRKLLRWQIKPSGAVGFVRKRYLATLLSVLSAWSRGSVICHLSSAWSKGCSVEAAMNTNCFPSILMLYLPHKSKSLLKHKQAAAAQYRKTLSGLQEEQEPAWIFSFKKLLKSSILSMTKILKCFYGYLSTEEIKTNLEILQQAHRRIFKQGLRLAKWSVIDHC